MFEARRIEPAEWHVLRDVRLRALAESPDSFGARLEDEVLLDEAAWRGRSKSSSWFVGHRGGEILGLAAGSRPDGFPDADRKLFSVWVDSAARGQGLVEILVDAVSRWAQADGALNLRLQVVQENTRARRAYEKMKFVVTPLVEEVQLSHDRGARTFVEYALPVNI